LLALRSSLHDCPRDWSFHTPHKRAQSHFNEHSRIGHRNAIGDIPAPLAVGINFFIPGTAEHSSASCYPSVADVHQHPKNNESHQISFSFECPALGNGLAEAGRTCQWSPQRCDERTTERAPLLVCPPSCVIPATAGAASLAHPTGTVIPAQRSSVVYIDS